MKISRPVPTVVIIADEKIGPGQLCMQTAAFFLQGLLAIAVLKRTARRCNAQMVL